MNVSWLRREALAALTLTLCACATAPPKALPHGDDREVIHEQDMTSLDRLNTFQVVQRLKPQWLRPRGQQALLDPGRVVRGEETFTGLLPWFLLPFGLAAVNGRRPWRWPGCCTRAII